MPFLGDEVAVRQVTDDDWRLLEDVVYEARSETFTIPAVFVTDFASVPKMMTWLVPRYGRYTRAAVLHDDLCRRAAKGRFSRYDADGIFRRAMRELGVGFLRRWVMWLAVRLGSGVRGLFERSIINGLAVLLAGLVCLALLSLPLVVVGVWLLALWFLEWLLFPLLKVGTRRKAVNRPRGLSGT